MGELRELEVSLSSGAAGSNAPVADALTMAAKCRVQAARVVLLITRVIDQANLESEHSRNALFALREVADLAWMLKSLLRHGKVVR